ncbi:MAG TPA: PA14 domain-containing protein [Herpetosiphonaceae bacterium]
MMVSTRLWLGGVISTRRDQILIDQLIQLIAACAVMGPLLIAVDGLRSYVDAIRRTFRFVLHTGRVGQLRKLAWPDLVIGQVVPRFSEPYTFITQNDDGVRLWVNNQLLIDDWHDHGLSEHQGSINLQVGVPVAIRLDYYENHGQAAVKLLWASPSQPKEVIPASQLLPPQ